MSCLNQVPYIADLRSSVGNVCCLIGAIRHFTTTQVISKVFFSKVRCYQHGVQGCIGEILDVIGSVLFSLNENLRTLPSTRDAFTGETSAEPEDNSYEQG